MLDVLPFFTSRTLATIQPCHESNRTREPRGIVLVSNGCHRSSKDTSNVENRSDKPAIQGPGYVGRWRDPVFVVGSQLSASFVIRSALPALGTAARHRRVPPRRAGKPPHLRWHGTSAPDLLTRLRERGANHCDNRQRQAVNQSHVSLNLPMPVAEWLSATSPSDFHIQHLAGITGARRST